VSTAIGAIVATGALGVTVEIGETEATGLAVSPERPVSLAKDKRQRAARRLTLRHRADRMPSPRWIDLDGCRGWHTRPRYLPLCALR
jgi:hypothetical protein